MDQKDVDARLKLILSAQVDKLDELEKVWMSGYAHGVQGEPDGNNPFPDSTVEHSYWLEGYQSGEYGEKPLFPEYISVLADHLEGKGGELEERKRFHLNKVDRLLAGTGVSVATASMVAAALINFVA